MQESPMDDYFDYTPFDYSGEDYSGDGGGNGGGGGAAPDSGGLDQAFNDLFGIGPNQDYFAPTQQTDIGAVDTSDPFAFLGDAAPVPAIDTTQTADYYGTAGQPDYSLPATLGLSNIDFGGLGALLQPVATKQQQASVQQAETAFATPSGGGVLSKVGDFLKDALKNMQMSAGGGSGSGTQPGSASSGLLSGNNLLLLVGGGLLIFLAVKK